MTDSPLNDVRIGQVSHQWAQAQKIASEYFATIDSTNKKAKDEAFSEKLNNEQILIYFADHQSEGKGRGKNTWETEQPGSQLLSTWSFLVEEAPRPILSPLVGLALFRAAASTWPFLNWNLKAPNDLYIDDKKVAGLLVETVSQGNDFRVLVGLGLNVISHPHSVEKSGSVVEKLPSGCPLLAQDWITFLERLLFEFSIALQLAFEPLNTTTAAALVSALNRHPLLSEKYVAMDSEANLKTAHKSIPWQSL